MGERRDFEELYLRRVFRTIRRNKLVLDGDKIFIALSGGKDSASCAYALRKYVEAKEIACQLVAFHINFNLPISERVEEVVRQQAELVGLELLVINVGDYGISMEELARSARRPICSCCGTIKRYLMNRVPREHGATKVATGHHMDDFLVMFFKNLLGQHFDWIAKFKPYLPSSHPKMVARIRPLFEVGGKDNQRLCQKVDMPFLAEDVCPHSYKGCNIDWRREKWYETIDEIERWQKNFKLLTIKSIYKMSDYFKPAAEESPILECAKCGEPTSTEICSFCRLLQFTPAG